MDTDIFGGPHSANPAILPATASPALCSRPALLPPLPVSEQASLSCDLAAECAGAAACPEIQNMSPQPRMCTAFPWSEGCPPQNGPRALLCPPSLAEGQKGAQPTQTISLCVIPHYLPPPLGLSSAFLAPLLSLPAKPGAPGERQAKPWKPPLVSWRRTCSCEDGEATQFPEGLGPVMIPIPGTLGCLSKGPGEGAPLGTRSWWETWLCTASKVAAGRSARSQLPGL